MRNSVTMLALNPSNTPLEAVENKHSGQPPSPHGETHGLRVLYQPPDVSKTLVDIVFVHGLTGDSYNTWLEKETQTYWPKDILSVDVPDARILAFGYDADVTKILGLYHKTIFETMPQLC